MKLAAQFSRFQHPKFLSAWEHERPSEKTNTENMSCIICLTSDAATNIMENSMR
jgi:hypothetical protein